MQMHQTIQTCITALTTTDAQVISHTHTHTHKHMHALTHTHTHTHQSFTLLLFLQVSVSQADALGEVEMCVAKTEERRLSKPPQQVQGRQSMPDPLCSMDNYSNVQSRTSLSSRLHQSRILSGGGGAIGSRCSEDSVATKRKRPRKTLNPRRFTPKYASLPRTGGPSKGKKAEVCEGGRTIAVCDDRGGETSDEYLSLSGGTKKFPIESDSVVLLDSEEENEQEIDRSRGNQEVVQTSSPSKGSAFGREEEEEEETDTVTVVEDSSDVEDNASVALAEAHLPVPQEGAERMLHLSEDEEEDRSDTEPMDTVSHTGGGPKVEEEEEEAASVSRASVGENGGHVPVVEMVLLSDEEKCVATEQTRTCSTLSKQVNRGSDSPFPPSSVASTISEKFRVTPSKATRTVETTPTEQWEPYPLSLACAPRKRSRTELDSSPASGEEEVIEKRDELSGNEEPLQKEKEFTRKDSKCSGKEKEFDEKNVKYVGKPKEFARKEKKYSRKERQVSETDEEFVGKQKDFGGKEKEFSGRGKVLKRKGNQGYGCGKANDGGNKEGELVDGALPSRAARLSRKGIGSSHLCHDTGVARSSWEEEEEDPLAVEESDSLLMSNSGLESEGQDPRKSAGDDPSPQQEGEGSLSSSREAPSLQSSLRHEPRDAMAAEVTRQKSLSLKHRQKMLSPLQQGLHDVNSEEEGEGGGSRFYQGGRRKPQAHSGECALSCLSLLCVICDV